MRERGTAVVLKWSKSRREWVLQCAHHGADQIVRLRKSDLIHAENSDEVGAPIGHCPTDFRGNRRECRVVVACRLIFRDNGVLYGGRSGGKEAATSAVRSDVLRDRVVIESGRPCHAE